jgi:hypothetical protein
LSAVCPTGKQHSMSMSMSMSMKSRELLEGEEERVGKVGRGRRSGLLTVTIPCYLQSIPVPVPIHDIAHSLHLGCNALSLLCSQTSRLSAMHCSAVQLCVGCLASDTNVCYPLLYYPLRCTCARVCVLYRTVSSLLTD